MSVLVTDKVQRGATSDDSNLIEERHRHHVPAPEVRERQINSLFAPSDTKEYDSQQVSAFCPFDYDYRGLLTVVCFLILVALLCAWFDQLVTLNRESAERRRPMLSGQLRQSVQWGSETLDSFQAILEGDATDVLRRLHLQSLSENSSLSPQQTTQEGEEGSTREMHAGTEENKKDSAAGSASGGARDSGNTDTTEMTT